MRDEPRHARAGAELRAYLAGHDVPCEQCGYNLRGTRDIQCPECGAVIPRPPSEDIERGRMDPAQLKLWCPECDYTVTGVNTPRCPECGAMKLVRFSAGKPRLPRKSWLRPRGLPTGLWINAIVGFIVAATAAIRGAASSTSLGRGGQTTCMVAAGFAIVPVLLAIAWWACRAGIRERSPRTRLALAAAGSLIGFVSWILGLQMVS